MINYNRVARLTVGPVGGTGRTLDANRIGFTVTKTDKPSANKMRVFVYNVSRATRALLETRENRIVLDAGYFANVRTVGIGNITRGSSPQFGPDVVTVAECGDGLLSLANSRVSLSYDGAVSASQIIGNIADEMGFELRETAADLSGKFAHGWAHVGPARDALTAVTRRFGLEWSVQDEVLQVVTERATNGTPSVVVSSQTGMIESPRPLDDARADLYEARENPGVSVKMLLNPLCEPGGLVSIVATGYNGGAYRIKRVEHTGDTHAGEWYTTIEAVEA